MFKLIAGLALTFATNTFADTALDGFWNLNPSYGVACTSGRKPSAESQRAFFQKYGRQQLHLSARYAVLYWTTPYGEAVTVPALMAEGNQPNQYFIRRPWLTVPDIELSLAGERLQLTSTDTEFGMCSGEKYRIYFDWLKLNP